MKTNYINDFFSAIRMFNQDTHSFVELVRDRISHLEDIKGKVDQEMSNLKKLETSLMAFAEDDSASALPDSKPLTRLPAAERGLSFLKTKQDKGLDGSLEKDLGNELKASFGS